MKHHRPLRRPCDRRAWLLALLALSLLAREGQAQGEVCDSPPPPSAVSLLILGSGSSVHELAKALARDATVVVKDAQTIIFDDGRVITADVGAAGDHLNRLGWGDRNIRVVASLPAPRARPRRARG